MLLLLLLLLLLLFITMMTVVMVVVVQVFGIEFAVAGPLVIGFVSIECTPCVGSVQLLVGQDASTSGAFMSPCILTNCTGATESESEVECVSERVRE